MTSLPNVGRPVPDSSIQCTYGPYLHATTRLSDGRPSLLLDIGSVGNLTGDQWLKDTSKLAIRYGIRPEQYKRERPFDVSGVGIGSQKCTHNCKIPLAIQRSDGTICKATFDTPAIPNAQLPALLGLDSLRKSRAIIDLNTLRLHMCGPGNYKLEDMLPPGTEHIQCVLAPSGHMVVPCGEYDALDTQQQ